jgi:hypothetical protein
MVAIGRHRHGFGAVAVAVSASFACSRPSPPEVDLSPTAQLTSNLIACDAYPDNVVAQTRDELSPGFVSGWTDPTSERLVYELLTGIPREYRQYLNELFIKKTFSGISPRDLDSGVMGVTYLEGFSNLYMYPTDLNIATVSGAITFALQHEVGHAVEGQIAKQADTGGGEGSFDQAMANYFQNEGKTNSVLRSYARSSQGEYWAEAFNNFYCSREAADLLKRELPQTYQFMERVLLPPAWTNPPGGGGGNNSSPATYIALSAATEDATAQTSRFNLLISTVPEIAAAFICAGTTQTCSGGTATKAKLTRIATHNNRAIYQSTDDLAGKPGEAVVPFTVLSYDSESAPTPVRIEGFQLRRK